MKKVIICQSWYEFEHHILNNLQNIIILYEMPVMNKF